MPLSNVERALHLITLLYLTTMYIIRTARTDNVFRFVGNQIESVSG